MFWLSHNSNIVGETAKSLPVCKVVLVIFIDMLECRLNSLGNF